MYKMGDSEVCIFDCLPENILIDVLSYLDVKELVRAGRVCKKWKRLVKVQQLWRVVDLTVYKGVTSSILWVLLRHYLGSGLICLRLRGLMFSCRRGNFFSEAWLRNLSTKCPRLRRLFLLHVDLKGLPSCRHLPLSLKVLELSGCELPLGFFNQALVSSQHSQTDATSSAGTQQRRRDSIGQLPSSPAGIGIEKLVLNDVSSFKDPHLQSLLSWERLSRIELRDTFVTAEGIRNCAAKDGIGGVEGLSRVKALEIALLHRQGHNLNVASLGLDGGWLGLEELILGGEAVVHGLLCIRTLKDLKYLCLWSCTLSETQVIRTCGKLRGLRCMEFLFVTFRVCQKEGGEEQGMVEAEGGDDINDESKIPVANDPIPSLRRSMAVLLPFCKLVYTKCHIQRE